MTELVGKALEEDDEFWGHLQAARESEDDDNYESESSEEDAIDSDFDIPEDNEDEIPAESVDQLEEEAKKKKNKFVSQFKRTPKKEEKKIPVKRREHPSEPSENKELEPPVKLKKTGISKVQQLTDSLDQDKVSPVINVL